YFPELYTLNAGAASDESDNPDNHNINRWEYDEDDLLTHTLKGKGRLYPTKTAKSPARHTPGRAVEDQLKYFKDVSSI
ncbi:hypothetical protein DXG01_011668, partial [Tephrocybe rancida]